MVVCGDGEYIIFTALAWRNKAFGQATEVVWAGDSNQFATRESTSKIKIFKNFKETNSFRPTFAPEGIFGGQSLSLSLSHSMIMALRMHRSIELPPTGTLLGVRGHDFVCLYDWDECKCIRKIDVVPKNVHNASRQYCLLLSSSSSTSFSSSPLLSAFDTFCLSSSRSTGATMEHSSPLPVRTQSTF